MDFKNHHHEDQKESLVQEQERYLNSKLAEDAEKREFKRQRDALQKSGLPDAYD